MAGQSQKIDDFVMQLGTSAKEVVSQDQLRAVNELIGSYDLSSKFFTFGNILENQRFSISGEKLGKSTVMAVIDFNAHRSEIGVGGSSAGHTDISPSLRRLLEREGVNIGDDVTGVALFDSKLMENIDSISQTATHELGHAATTISGIRQVPNVSRDYLNAFEMYRYHSDVPLAHARDMQAKFTAILREHGLEEGRAEAFAFQNFEKKLLNIGTPVDVTRFSFNNSPILTDKMKDFRSSGYFNAGGFKSYSDRHSTMLQSVYERLGDDLEYLPSPLTGKTGLTVTEMMQDTGLYARARAVGSFHGTLERMPGHAGVQAKELIARSITGMRESAEQHFPDKAKALMSTIEEATADTMAEGRGLSILTNAESSVKASIASSRPLLQLREAATAAEETIQTARPLIKSSGILDAAAAAAESIVKRDSIGMKIAGAATTILRRRI